jgi:hypothetical protein
LGPPWAHLWVLATALAVQLVQWCRRQDNALGKTGRERTRSRRHHTEHHHEPRGTKRVWGLLLGMG